MLSLTEHDDKQVCVMLTFSSPLLIDINLVRSSVFPFVPKYAVRT